MFIIKGIFRFIITPLLILLSLAVVAIAAIYLYYTPQLPSKDEISNIELQVPLRIYDKKGNLMAEYGANRRIPKAYNEIPENLINAFVTAEDNRFFEHSGIDTKGVIRAVVNLIKTGSKTQGASTITMQLARNAYLGHERTFNRKAKEAFLALKIEQTLSKKDIIETYLNKIYMGHRAYGVAAAAYVYYGKTLEELTLAQMAMIAGLPKAPSRFNPIVNPERAKIRRDYILKRMNELAYITQEDYETSIASPITARVHRSPIATNAPYMAEMARAYAVDEFGEEEAYSLGYKVYTTLEPEEQKVAEQTLRDHLISYSRRHGYRGAEKQLSLAEYPDQASLLKRLQKIQTYGNLYPAVVLESSSKTASLLIKTGDIVDIGVKQVRWARKYISEDRRGRQPSSVSQVLKVGDVVRMQRLQEKDKDSGETQTTWKFSQLPTATGALVSMDPNTGAVRAVVGGFDYFYSKFNRATQAKRQPGSSFKPFVYAAALAKGYKPSSIVNDAPIHIPGSRWRPTNFGGRFYGPTPLDKALAKSRNLVSIRLMRSIGIDYTIEFALRFGFLRENLPRNLTLALGTGSTTPLEMARAYSAFANGGFRVNSHFIDRVIDNNGELVSRPPLPIACKKCEVDEEAINDLPFGTKPARRIMNTSTHYGIVSMMQGVTRSGTAASAGRILKRKDIAGKTGTTNDQRDAWFGGYSPDAVAVVWMGFDDLSKLGEGETATRAALPVWIDFMKYRLDGLEDKGWKKSDTLIRVKLDKKTGKLATDKSKAVIEETLDKPEEAPKKPRSQDKKSEGFESFGNYSPEQLNKPTNEPPARPRPERNNEREESRSNNRSNDNDSRPAAPTPAPRPAPKPERVEIPEQLF
ncbi:MAG: penicillin-binding protein 1A [bacterium]